MAFSTSLIKKAACCLLALFLLSFSAPDAQASWLLDPAGFHVSAHGQTACLDCHGDVADQQLHPKPANVNKQEKAFFKADQCLVCHDEVMENLDQGIHGAGEIKNPAEYQYCLKCHNPHTQPRLGGNRMGTDPDKAPQEQCGACHKEASALPPLSVEDAACMTCHQTRNPEDPEDIKHIQSLCLHCHGNSGADAQVKTGRHIPLMDKTTYAHTPHASMACTACHQNAAAFGHNRQPTVDCRRCHFAGNTLGAASMVLPAKSILCMPCHTATFSLNDTISIVSLLIFLCGMVLFISVFLTGTMTGVSSQNPVVKLLHALWAMVQAIFSPKIFKIAQSLFWDAFLQRRLYRRSPGRWFIHGLIFYPFVVRFFWGLTALLGSLWGQGNPAWDMINKNHPLTAFLFDLTGIMILSGILLAWIRGVIGKRNRAVGTPDQDRVALALIGGIVIIGFLLEGMRIVMTGQAANAAWSFAGYGVSLWFEPSRGLPEVYSFMWYIHAALTGAFIAYIPFSRLLHMILAPVAISMNAVSPAHGHNDENPNEKT